MCDDLPDASNLPIKVPAIMATIDIEVKSENGFPSPTEAKEELLSITIKNHQSKKIVVWGIGDFTTERKDVTYIKC